MNLKALIAAPIVAWLMIANAATIVKPLGWSYGSTGKDSESYQMGVDTSVTWQGKPALTVVASGQRSTATGDLHARTSTGGYGGKRVRFSGMLKLADVDGWAGAYLLADNAQAGNFYKPQPGVGGKGSAQWTPVSVVIQVPMDTETSSIRMGLILLGNGQAWLSDLKFEEVADDVPLTTSRVEIDEEQLRRDRESAVLAMHKRGKSAPYNLELKTQ